MRRARTTGWLLVAAVVVPLACGDMRQDDPVQTDADNSSAAEVCP